MLNRIIKFFKKPLPADTASKSTKAMVFVDFEHWYYSYRDNFNMKPEPEKVFQTIKSQYDIEEIMVFADLSRSELQECLTDLRPSVATVIDTGENFFQRKKSVTDFVMLDRIYRTSVRSDIGTFIILTGDGHFRFAVEYLSELGKDIVVYGVTGSVSRALRNAAPVFEELPAEEERYRSYFTMVAAQMAFLNDKTNVTPTFLKTSEQVAAYNNVPRDRIIDAVKKMIDIGYLYQKDQPTAYGRDVRALKANWELMLKDGIWSQEREDEVRTWKRK